MQGSRQARYRANCTFLGFECAVAGSSNSFSESSEVFISSLIKDVPRMLAYFVEPLYKCFFSGCTGA